MIVKFAASIDSPFQERFLGCRQCCLIAFYPQKNFFQNWSQSSQTLLLSAKLMRCSKSFVVISTRFTVSSPGLDSFSRNHFFFVLFFGSYMRNSSSSIKVVSRGVPVLAQWKQIRLGTMRLPVQSLALLSGLRIRHCCELWCGSQVRLQSHVTVALA